jgi:hypothetical protein
MATKIRINTLLVVRPEVSEVEDQPSHAVPAVAAGWHRIGNLPYLGGSVSADQLRSVVMAYESVIVSGRPGAKLAAQTSMGH